MKNLNCLITGASSGIGKEIAIELSKVSFHIYITSRNINKLEEVHDLVIKNDCNCTIVPMDLTKENVIENLAHEIFKKNKTLDVLIHSAGIIDHLSPIDSINLDKLKNVINLNYISSFRILKSFHPLLKNEKKSHLGILSSVSDTSKEQYWGVYQPIMSALNELLQIYAYENKNTKIKANIFCPSAVNTEFRQLIMPGEDKSKISSPKEVASKIVNYILNTEKSGEVIKIN